MITAYLLIGLLVIDFIVFVNDGYITSAFGLLLIGAGAWYWIPEFSTFVEQHNLGYLIGWYLGIGVIVTLVKWGIVNIAHYSKLKRANADFQKQDHEYASLQARHLAFAKFWNRFYKRGSTDPLAPEYTTSYSSPDDIINALTIRARDHVDRMAGWIFQWPFVVIAAVFEDLIINLSKHIAIFVDWAFNRFSRFFVASSLRDL